MAGRLNDQVQSQATGVGNLLALAGRRNSLNIACSKTDREMRLRALASKLFFTLRREGPRFGLYRDVDVSTAVRHDGLSLDEVEDILNTWKFRGPHGG
jgi:hypothetical protein